MLRTIRLSVIVIFYNSRREARRTLYSLSPGYQAGIDPDLYEVISIDNGSKEPLLEEDVRQYGANFKYRYYDTDSSSPVAAIDEAVKQASGEFVMVIIDGAHILSPGILDLSLKALSVFSKPFVATVPFHIGPKRQNISILEGYNQEVENKILDNSGWEKHGYNLFKCAGDYADASNGWFGCLFESSCYAFTKQVFYEAGGFHKEFQSPGGGLVNLDFFQNVMRIPDIDYVMLLGEGTFHQFHGGVASNAPRDRHPWNEFHEEFVRIRGRTFELVPRRPIFFGKIRPEMAHIASASFVNGMQWWKENWSV